MQLDLDLLAPYFIGSMMANVQILPRACKMRT